MCATTSPKFEVVKSSLRGGQKLSPSQTEIVSAANAFTTIILCESNEKKGPMACNMVTDMSYRVGGSEVETENVKPIDAHGFNYLGRSICVHVKIPSDARTSYNNGVNGVTLELSVSNKRIRTKEVACNLSHVVWQSKEAFQAEIQ